MAGTGIGGGVMAIPLLFSNAGLYGGLIAFVAAFVCNIFLNFLVADITLNTGHYDIPSIFGSVLHDFPFRKQFETVVYVLLACMLVINLSAYIVGGADILASLLPVSPLASRLIFYFLAVLPALFGLKVIGISEKYLVCIMVGLVVFFSAVSFFHPHGFTKLYGTVGTFFAVFSMVMFSMSSLFVVPDVVKGLQNDRRKIHDSILIGLLINLVISLDVCFSVLISSSEEITEMAAVGWIRSVGSFLHVPLSVFILAAMLTSFWMLSFSFSNMILGRCYIDPRFCYLLATLPSLLISFVPAASFSALAKTAAGVVAVLIGIAMIPTYYRCAKSTGKSPLLGTTGTNPAFLAALLIGNLLMAIGALC